MGGALGHAIQLCPFVVDVEIVDLNQDGIKGTDLLSLLNLENLHRFVLGRFNVSFHEGILPILEKFGRDSLEILELCHVRQVDYAAVIRHCPNLRSLKFFECNGSLSSQPFIQHQQLLHLNSLDFWGGDPTTATLTSLLCSCPALVKLHLGRLDGLTDQVIGDASTHGFAKLEELNLLHCNRITKKSIDLFVLALGCPFKIVWLSCCEQLRNFELMFPETISAWLNKAQENGGKLFIVD